MIKDKILVTGAAGFIGFNLSQRLLLEGYDVIGIDDLNEYYDVTLKESRLEILDSNENFKFYKVSLEDFDSLSEIFENYKFKYVVNLAAQAGVRYSITNPQAYINSNIVGFTNILECCRYNNIKHLLYASSSSVYGSNKKVPFSVKDNVDHPISLYAATKKSNELMAHCYSHLYNIPTTGLRFFTVYGPWGRPDMALFKFTKAIINEENIQLYNNGNMLRDFTYIDDIIEGVFRLITKVPTIKEEIIDYDNDPSTSSAPYRVFNIGNNNPVKLLDFVKVIENEIGIKAKIQYMDIQPGDVEKTCADVQELMNLVDFKPNTSIEVGVRNFVRWYRKYYKV